MTLRGPLAARAFLRAPGRPYVLGHRGARRRAPENTHAAFELALAEGADGVELDVRLDRDGDVVVLHDRDLSRVTGGSERADVETLGRTDLARIDLGGGERVPRLEDVLAWARREGARVNVELKRDTTRRALLVARVAGLVAREPDARARLVLSSFDPLLVAACARLLPWVTVGLLVERQVPLPGAGWPRRLLGATALHPAADSVTAASIAPWQRVGCPVNVWTVNDPERARELDALGVDAIITDVPGDILAALAARPR